MQRTHNGGPPGNGDPCSSRIHPAIHTTLDMSDESIARQRRGWTKNGSDDVSFGHPGLL